MEKTMVQKLTPWVTMFSAAMPSNCKHGDVVCIGGEIKDIFAYGGLFDYESLNEEKKLEASITLDDSLGRTELLFFGGTFDHFNKDYQLREGMIVIAEGKVWSDPKTKKHPENEYDEVLVCYNIYPLPEE